MSELEPIRRSVRVRCGREHAFRVFTEGMGSWWPVELHSRAVHEFEEEGLKVERIEFQGRIGGKILEHMSNGMVLPWGEVTAWDPPSRFVLAWKPNSSDRPPTEVEVSFTAKDGGTLVELEHRGWERVDPAVMAEAKAGYAAGWIAPLERFASKADEEVT